MTGEPCAWDGPRHRTRVVCPAVSTAASPPCAHGSYTIVPWTAAPPYASHTSAWATWPPTPPRGAESTRYAVPLLPSASSIPSGSSAGWVEPRSRSFWLSRYQLDGAKMPVRFRSGDSAVTASFTSSLVRVTEPFPTLTYMVPSGQVTGPEVPQMAPSRAVGTM